MGCPSICGSGFIFPREPLVGCGTKLDWPSAQSSRTTSSSPHLMSFPGCGLAAAIIINSVCFFVENWDELTLRSSLITFGCPMDRFCLVGHHKRKDSFRKVFREPLGFRIFSFFSPAIVFVSLQPSPSPFFIFLYRDIPTLVA